MKSILLTVLSFLTISSVQAEASELLHETLRTSSVQAYVLGNYQINSRQFNGPDLAVEIQILDSRTREVVTHAFVQDQRPLEISITQNGGEYIRGRFTLVHDTSKVYLYADLSSGSTPQPQYTVQGIIAYWNQTDNSN